MMICVDHAASMPPRPEVRAAFACALEASRGNPSSLPGEGAVRR